MDEWKKHPTQAIGQQQKWSGKCFWNVWENVQIGWDSEKGKQQEKLKTKKVVRKNKPTH